MRDRDCYFSIGDAQYNVAFHIDSFGHSGNGWDDPGEGPEWHIVRILDLAGNDVTGLSGVYSAAEQYLCDNPAQMEYIDDDYYEDI